MKIVYQVLIMLLGAASLAGLQGLYVGTKGSSVESAKYGLEVEDALGLSEVLWIDARPEEAFLESHYPGALHLNEDNWFKGIGVLLEAWDPAVTIVVYCDGEGCAASRHLAERIRTELGLEPVYWLVGGWQALDTGKGDSR